LTSLPALVCCNPDDHRRDSKKHQGDAGLNGTKSLASPKQQTSLSPSAKGSNSPSHRHVPQSIASSTASVASPGGARSGSSSGADDGVVAYSAIGHVEVSANTKTSADPFGLFTPPEFLEQTITLSPKLTAEQRRDARIRAAAREFRTSERARKNGSTAPTAAAAGSTSARARATAQMDRALGGTGSKSSGNARRTGPAASGLQPLEQVPMLRVPVGLDPTTGSVPIEPRLSNHSAPRDTVVNGSVNTDRAASATDGTRTAANGHIADGGDETHAVEVALWEQAPPAPLPPLRFLRPRRLAADLAGDR
jgi:hypothetical protein